MLILFYVGIILLMVVFVLMLIFQINKHKLEKDIQRFIETYNEMSDFLNHTVSSITVTYQDKVGEMRSVMKDADSLLNRFEQIKNEQDSKISGMQDLLLRIESAKTEIVREISTLKTVGEFSGYFEENKPVQNLKIPFTPENLVKESNQNNNSELLNMEKRVFFSGIKDELKVDDKEDKEDNIINVETPINKTLNNKLDFQEINNEEIEQIHSDREIKDKERSIEPKDSLPIENPINKEKPFLSVPVVTPQESKGILVRKKAENRAGKVFSQTVFELFNTGMSVQEIARKTGKSIAEVKMVLKINSMERNII